MRRPSAIFYGALFFICWICGTTSTVLLTLLFAAAIAVIARMYLFEHVLQVPVPSNAAVLVTGCSSGFGREMVIDLSARGFLVLAGVRKPEDFDRVIQFGAEGSRQRIVPVLLDVSKPEDITRAVSFIRVKLEEASCRLYAVVCNAGVAGLGPVEAVPLDKMRYTFEVNFWGPVSLVRACMPLLRDYPGNARILLVTSIGGVTSVLNMGFYCSSKFALEAWGDALRQELKVIKSKISVTVLEPGTYDTAICDQYSLARKELIDDEKDRNGPMVQLYSKMFTKQVDVSNASRSIIGKPDGFAKQVALVLLAKFPPARIMAGIDRFPMAFVANYLPEPAIDLIFRLALLRSP
jgi:NAD(P)-dependent dehydrogenase (short-subunit alcohol dehydrogenase family)